MKESSLCCNQVDRSHPGEEGRNYLLDEESIILKRAVKKMRKASKKVRIFDVQYQIVLRHVTSRHVI